MYLVLKSGTGSIFSFIHGEILCGMILYGWFGGISFDEMMYSMLYQKTNHHNLDVALQGLYI